MTAPSGFRAAGLHCGIKASGKPDLSLIVSDRPAAAAGLFTINLAKAAPLYLCEEHLAKSGAHARAIVTNSGCANACTGPRGESDAREMAQLTAAAVGCNKEHVLVASTGVIGVNLKMDAIRSGIPMAVKALEADTRLDSAVLMTWDSSPAGDRGWVAALRWLRAHVADDLATAHVPEAERPKLLAARYQAIDRTTAKLDGSLLEDPG